MRIKDPEAYSNSIGKMAQIRKYCDENNIDDFATLLDRCKEEKPEWLKTIRGYGGMNAMITYFRRKRVAQKHKEAMKNEPPNNRKAKPVICVDNGLEFRSINAAAKWVGVAHTQMIADCCRGVIDNVRGYKFRFKE